MALVETVLKIKQINMTNRMEIAEHHTESGSAPYLLASTFQPTSADRHGQQQTFPYIQGLVGFWDRL